MGLCSLAVVALLALAGVRSADVDLGGTCTSNDTCVHPSLLLACSIKDGDMTKSCLIKAGQACATGLEAYCVSGADCQSNVCTCKASSVYTLDDGLCTVAADKWSGACASGACAETSLECKTDLDICLCVADTTVVLTTGLCTGTINNETIGKACNDSDKATTCGTTASTNLDCSAASAGKCTCSAGYTGVPGGTCTAISNEKSGKICVDSNKTTTCGTTSSTFLECPTSGGNCGCQTGYTAVPGISCYPSKGQLNGGCSVTGSTHTCTNTTHQCTGTPALKCTEPSAMAVVAPVLVLLLLGVLSPMLVSD